jgi:hypothetical protein
MLHILDIVSYQRVPFRVVLIPANMQGPNEFRCPANNGRPMVEFYDRRGHDTDLPGFGQFTGGYYYLSTLLGLDDFSNEPVDGEGLNLHGGVPEWSIDGAAYRIVIAWLRLLGDRPTLERG